MRKSLLYIIFYSTLLLPVPSRAQTIVSLVEALQQAKKSNPDLTVAEYTIDEAEADLTSAAVRPNPIFNTQLLHIANTGNRAEGTSAFNGANTQYWYQLTKPFQIAGQRSGKMAFSHKMVIQSRLDYDEKARNIFYTVANKWLDVWDAKVTLDILQKGKTNIDSLVQINEIRLKNQVITHTDLLRAQLLQQQYQRNIITAQQLYTREIRNLKFLIGATDSVNIDLSDNSFAAINTAGDSLMVLGIHNRSDIFAAKNTIDAAATNIRLQRSLAFPQPEAGVIWNPQNKIPYIGFYGNIEIPLFNRNQGDREKAAVLKLQAEQHLWTLEHQAETEITNAYRAYVTQRENLADYKSNLKQAETILSNVRYAYLKGGTSIIDLLEAQRSWLDTQQQYYSTMQDFRRSYVELLYATGIINQLAE